MFKTQVSKWSFNYTAGYEYQNFKHDSDNFNLTSKGFIPLNLNLNFDKKSFPEYFRINVKWTELTADNLVFQDTIDNLYIYTHYLFKPHWGVYVESRPIVSRLSFESLQSEAKMFIGARYQKPYFGINLGLGEDSVFQLRLDNKLLLYKYSHLSFHLYSELEGLINKDITSMKAFIGVQIQFNNY